MQKFVFAVILVSLTGCVGQHIVLQNQEGESASCKVSTGSAMMTGVIMRDRKMRKCVEDYEAEGYTKVIKAEQKL